MKSLRSVRVLLALLVLVPTAFGVLAGPGVVDQAAAVPTWTLTVQVDGSGTVDVVPSETLYEPGAPVQLTASAATGWYFVDWTGDASGAANPVTVTMDGHKAVTANFAVNQYTLTYNAGPGGTISGDTSQTVNSGANGTAVTAVPNTGAGYHFVNWSDGELNATRTETNVTANHNVTANFALNTYTLTYTAGPGGTISGATSQTVDSGASGSAVTAVPNTGAGYHFVSWSDGVPTATRTDANVTANHTVTANFALNTFTLTYTAGPGGTISGATSQTVSYGANGSAVTAVPNTGAGYHFVSWSDGVPTATRTETNVTANHNVSATFAINQYTITPTAGANGAISPATVQTVNYGATPTFTIKAATGYYVADVLVDGASVGPVTRYIFPAVAANHTISASFAVGVQTRLPISVAKTIVTYGSSTKLTGVLYNSADPLHEVGMGDRLVTVQSASSPAGPWVDLKTLTTSSVAGSVGTFSVTVTPTGSTYYRLHFVAAVDSGYGSVLSYFVRVGVRPVLGTPQVPSSVRARRSFTVFGTLTPRFPAGQKTVAIKVYRYKNRHWVFTRQVSATNGDSGGNTRYAVKLKLTAKGKYRFRAYSAPSAAWADATTARSRVLTVR